MKFNRSAILGLLGMLLPYAVQAQAEVPRPKSFKSRAFERFLAAKNSKRLKFAVCFMLYPECMTEAVLLGKRQSAVR